MTYDEMIEQVCCGKIAYRITTPDMFVYRQGDTIIRQTHRKCEINQVFIASVAEIHANDWDVIDDNGDSEELDVLDRLIANNVLIVDLHYPTVPTIRIGLFE